MTEDYGTLMARKAYERRLARDSREVVQSSRRVVNSSRRAPSPKWLPDLSGFDCMEGIRWENNTSICRSVVDCFNGSPFVILRMPTGSGKTSAAVQSLGSLGGRFIVVAPKAVVEGGGWQRTVNAYNRDHPGVGVELLAIETFDRFSNMLADSKVRCEIQSRLGPDGVIVLDEVHAYKTPTSKRAKMMCKMRGFRMLGLTATPFTNDAVMDGVSYLVLRGVYSSKTNFLQRSGLEFLMDKFHRPLIYTDGEVDEAKWPYYGKFRRELGEMIISPDVDLSSLDMPGVVERIVQLDFDGELASRLRSIGKAYRKGAFESAIDLAMSMVEAVGCSRVRLDKLVALLRGDGVRQPIVFYWNNCVLEALLERLRGEGFNPQVLNGGVDFSSLDLSSNEPILIQYQAGAEGVEFKRSNLTVFYQNQSSAAKLLQAKGRNVRRGMKHDVLQVSMVSECQFDVAVVERLSNRMEISENVLAELAVDSLKEL